MSFVVQLLQLINSTFIVCTIKTTSETKSQITLEPLNQVFTRDVSTSRSQWIVFSRVTLFNSLKRGNVITCLWTGSNRKREGWLLNAEVEYLLLYLVGSREGSGREGKRLNYVCTSTSPESADSRAQHAHSSDAAGSRTTPLSGRQRATGPAELRDWSGSWIFDKFALWHAPRLTLHHTELHADS